MRRPRFFTPFRIMLHIRNRNETFQSRGGVKIGFFFLGRGALQVFNKKPAQHWRFAGGLFRCSWKRSFFKTKKPNTGRGAWSFSQHQTANGSRLGNCPISNVTTLETVGHDGFQFVPVWTPAAVAKHATRLETASCRQRAARRGLVGLPVWGLDHGKCPAMGVRTLFSKRDGAPSALHGLSGECKALVISTSAVYATAKIDPAVVNPQSASQGICVIGNGHFSDPAAGDHFRIGGLE